MGMDISGCMLPRKVIDVVRHDPSPYVPLGRLALEASPNCKPALAESVVAKGCRISAGLVADETEASQACVDFVRIDDVTKVLTESSKLGSTETKLP